MSRHASPRIGGAISWVLRHDVTAPVDSVGWLPLEEILKRIEVDGAVPTIDDILREVGPGGNDRFELSIDGTKARAFYGHSNPAIHVELTDTDRAPKYVYHATPEYNLDAILDRKEGLLPQKRLFVHAHEDPMHAVTVGRRRRAPIALFEIETAALPEPIGRTSAESAVWLTTYVPAKLLWKIAVPENAN